MPPRRRRKGGTTHDRIEARRKRYSDQELKQAITMFFHAIDEDSSGKLEPHEFAVAQAVVAELAGEDFDDEVFESINAWDKDRSGSVTLKEFSPVMKDLCDVLQGNRADIVESLAEKATTYINHMRREVGREIREFFVALDADKSGTLNEDQMKKMTNLALQLQRELKLELPGGVPVEQYLSVEKFDSRKDGLVSMGEFIEHFLDFTKLLKIPKKDLIARLKKLVEDAKDEDWEPQDVDGIKREISKIDHVLDKYR